MRLPPKPKATQRLHWSNISAYRDCPQKFLWGRGWPTIDLGNGLGRKKYPKEKRSEHHAVMGRVIADVLERFYNDRLWQRPKDADPNEWSKQLKTSLEAHVEREFQRQMDKSFIEFRSGPNDFSWQRSEPVGVLFETARSGVLNFVFKTLKKARLLGEYSKAEVKMNTKIDRWLPVGARPDLILRRDGDKELSGITILDGKNSGTVGRNDPDQLIWYALCFYLVFKKVPDRLAWIYYRYPAGTDPEEIKYDKKKYKDGPPPEFEDWKGIVEVPFDVSDLRRMAKEAKEIYRAMEAEKFDPTPSTNACQFCDFQNECEARRAWKAENKKPSKTEIGKQLKANPGLVEFEM